ncbi:DivIVA domain-containing protein [Pseudoclavibacter caeni]|jgi:DivIVA domain-containing protein|uniref:Cell wall synthesis protein Wag31 n=1 Tax=Pseudoclavibacter caeni TaxID=908846 RepID=A0A7C8BP79_9MICO|nr:DivIVA domain-containing protein [Pseudoclavibacter caeni]KAB1632975.1 DivIVA domain-containing protein [Pseudoclavibacter caeni]NYJ97051.1 DivIVA domain-containing protein [Pseudoclavibacter caeni]
MALTPDDVLNKRFTTTKFRDGYEQDEVDDFLDEVVVEFRRLTEENEELKAKVAAGGDSSELQGKLDKAEAEVARLQKALASRPAQTAARPAASTAQPAGPQNESDQATSLLQLARKLHDEHVREGEQTKEKLISEAQGEARRILSEVQERKTRELNDLSARKTRLEGDIKELETFERQYRSSLKSWINGQLKDLENSGSLADSTTKSVHGTARK